MNLQDDQLERNEEIITVLQEHWIVLIMPIFVFIIGWFIFFLLFFLAASLRLFSPSADVLILWLAFAVLLASIHFFFLFFIEYLISTVVVTNKHLIEIRFFPFFLDDVSYIEISQIHEIDKRKHGIIQNLLNYGVVCINIPRRNQTIIFQFVRYPSKFINLIEAIKNQKPLIKGDLKAMGASCPEKYKYLLE